MEQKSALIIKNLAPVISLWKLACENGLTGYQKDNVSPRLLILNLSGLTSPSANLEISAFGLLVKTFLRLELQQRRSNEWKAPIHTAKLEENSLPYVTYQAIDLH